MTGPDEVRKDVARTYAKAVSTPSPGPCCSEPVQKGVVSKLAGYTREELSALPAEAVSNSFGCGNPLALSEVREGDVVLDLGSGAGIDILLAGKKVGANGRAIGIDMTDEMIAKAHENIAASGLANVEVRKGEIEDMPVDSASVDWVISNCVINLSPQKEKVFAEIARVLRPGGRMLISDIVVQDLPEWVRADKRLYSSCISGAISEEAYLAGLRRAGLEDVEVRQRIVYDACQLSEFMQSELPEAVSLTSCCGQSAGSDLLENAARDLAGKIWSAKVYAKKPQS